MKFGHQEQQSTAGIGLDIGGTKLAGVVIDPSGSVVASAGTSVT